MHHCLPRAIGLCGIVDSATDLTVVGEAETGVKAVELARQEVPDIVLMDVRMPDMDGLEATELVTASTSARVLILTTFDVDEYVYRALRGGASGFLLKDTSPQELLAAIRVIAAGDALLAPSMTRRLINEFTARPEPQRPAPRAFHGLTSLTDRERQVLTLVAEGLSNAEIALRLHITTGTAKTHVGNLLTKLNARDRVQLVITAYRCGLATSS